MEKTFADCLLCHTKGCPTPNFMEKTFTFCHKNREICESFLPRKFSAIQVFLLPSSPLPPLLPSSPLPPLLPSSSPPPHDHKELRDVLLFTSHKVLLPLTLHDNPLSHEASIFPLSLSLLLLSLFPPFSPLPRGCLYPSSYREYMFGAWGLFSSRMLCGVLGP